MMRKKGEENERKEPKKIDYKIRLNLPPHPSERHKPDSHGNSSIKVALHYCS